MRKQVLIAKQTGAVNLAVYIPHNCTIVVDGNLAANVIPLNHIGADGIALTSVTDTNGNVELSATNTGFSNFTPSHIMIQKPITANAVGILLIIM